MIPFSPMTRPRPHAAIIAQGTGYRACQLCTTSKNAAGELVCTSRRVTGHFLRPVPVCDARAIGGRCGPEANHLTLSGEMENAA